MRAGGMPAHRVGQGQRLPHFSNPLSIPAELAQPPEDPECKAADVPRPGNAVTQITSSIPAASLL